MASALLCIALMMQKKMYKVLTPIQKRNGGSWFMTIGDGFTNKDDSINLYLHAIPTGGLAPGQSMTIQIRELDENDLRQREARREASRSGSGAGSGSGYGQRSSGTGSGFDAPSGTGPGGGLGASESSDAVPF